MLKTNKTNVGADASVCPKLTKTCPKKFVNRLNQPAAITLIALIITIIVLIILVGVTLNLTLGENGIFNKSKQGVDKYEESSVAEALRLAIVDADLTNYTENKNEGYFNYLKTEGYIEEIQETATINNKDVKISSRTEAREETEELKGKKGQVDTKKTIGKETKRKYYLYENGELYVEMQDEQGERYIEDLWNENGVNNNDEEETTIAELIKQGKIHVGEYVDYEKLIGTERSYDTWKCDSYLDVIGNKTLSAENLSWKLLSINETENKITLISETPTHTVFDVPKDKTEDEIINKLNEACNTLYGGNGFECRNLDYKDILEGYNDNKNIEDIIIGSTKDQNYYYEGRDNNYAWFYPMLLTDISRIMEEEKSLYGIYQLGWEGQYGEIRVWDRDKMREVGISPENVKPTIDSPYTVRYR